MPFAIRLSHDQSRIESGGLPGTMRTIDVHKSWGVRRGQHKVGAMGLPVSDWRTVALTERFAGQELACRCAVMWFTYTAAVVNGSAAFPGLTRLLNVHCRFGRIAAELLDRLVVQLGMLVSGRVADRVDCMDPGRRKIRLNVRRYLKKRWHRHAQTAELARIHTSRLARTGGCRYWRPSVCGGRLSGR